jgi:hypothetical protein
MALGFLALAPSSPRTKPISSTHHLGHPRVTVARQSDWALFNLAKSTSLNTRKKVANHSPWTPQGKQTSSKDIWSGDFHSSPIHSNTCIEVTSGILSCTYDFDSCQIEFKNNLFEDLTVTNAGLCMECAVDALAVPSEEHTPLSEIVVWLQGSKESSPPGRMT